MTFQLTQDALNVLEHFQGGIELTHGEAIELIPNCTRQVLDTLKRHDLLVVNRCHANITLLSRKDNP